MAKKLLKMVLLFVFITFAAVIDITPSSNYKERAATMLCCRK
jgi:hypothetical protein